MAMPLGGPAVHKLLLLIFSFSGAKLSNNFLFEK